MFTVSDNDKPLMARSVDCHCYCNKRRHKSRNTSSNAPPHLVICYAQRESHSCTKRGDEADDKWKWPISAPSTPASDAGIAVPLSSSRDASPGDHAAYSVHCSLLTRKSTSTNAARDRRADEVPVIARVNALRDA